MAGRPITLDDAAKIRDWLLAAEEMPKTAPEPVGPGLAIVVVASALVTLSIIALWIFG